ncbi:hypothetical protein GCM10007874_67100 [Labrys miyagiensis]|uniref:DUF930 domain-containing protein n=1 Tax=Labrys miyagiensis TaxID=346912 RepID=A0ABQ6CVH6_9HYPH|nr:DUF930 domain-containing protein [Labrys miyagiensis]GLS23689.1 hypothetical protein GCM10007874_67100 [Labrys miyagiensis]
MKRILVSIALLAIAVSPVLARQTNRQSKTEAGLAKLAPSDRFQQVCDIELMERLRRAGQPYNKPDSVIAYALGDPAISGDVLKGDGGAFRSGGMWYQYSFTCSATPDRMKVITLDYKVGQAVPRGEWDAHGLSIH